MVSRQVTERARATGGQLPADRRLVTALFADVSGFTPLTARLDAEEVSETIGSLISRLAGVISRYDGNVEKYAGDAILAVFGAPIAHDDDAARALRAALDLHTETGRIAAELGGHASDLLLHIGVNSGHVVTSIIGSEARTDYVVFGDAVNTAQRLESVAPPGETYVGELTRRLAGDEFEFEELAPLTLKGKSEPVPAWKLGGLREHAARSSAPLVGRDAEMATLTAVLDGLEEAGRVVVVSGDPGIGKSRLTAELRERARARGVFWLDARCLAYGAGTAYWPFAELIRTSAGAAPETGSDEALARIETLLGELGLAEEASALALLAGFEPDDAALAELEPQALRRRLQDAVTTWLERLAARGAVVLAVDDVQWADASSAALLAETARLSSRLPFCLYVTSRSRDAEALAPLEALDPTVVVLSPLGVVGTTVLCEQSLGDPVSRTLAQAVHDRTSGNPYFVAELLRSLQEAETVCRVDGSWDLQPDWDAAAIPATIEGVLSARFDRLPYPAATVLLTASVVGRRVRLPLLRLVERDVSDIAGALAILVDAGLLEPGDGPDELVFHHALLQDAAYARLLKRHRKELHRRTADAAEQLYGAGDDVIDLLAHHLYLGEAGAKAVDTLVRAGERSRGLYANDAAILHFERALELVRSDEELSAGAPELMLVLADLKELAGDYGGAAVLFDEVRAETGDVRAWRGLAATFRKRGRYPEALELLDAAPGENGDSRSLWLERARSLALTGRFPEALAAAQHGLAADPVADDVRGQLLLQLAFVEGNLADTEASLAHTLEAATIFDDLGEPRGLATALRGLGAAFVAAGRHDEAHDALLRGLATAERTGSVEEIGASLVNLGLLAVERRDWDEAITVTKRAIDEFERVGHIGGRLVATVNLSEALLEAGRLDDAEQRCREAMKLAGEADNPLLLADATRNLANVRLATGDPRAGAQLAETAGTAYIALGVVSDAVETLGVAARAWREAGDEERAAAAEATARSLEAKPDA